MPCSAARSAASKQARVRRVAKAQGRRRPGEAYLVQQKVCHHQEAIGRAIGEDEGVTISVRGPSPDQQARLQTNNWLRQGTEMESEYHAEARNSLLLNHHNTINENGTSPRADTGPSRGHSKKKGMREKRILPSLTRPLPASQA